MKRQDEKVSDTVLACHLPLEEAQFFPASYPCRRRRRMRQDEKVSDKTDIPAGSAESKKVHGHIII